MQKKGIKISSSLQSAYDEMYSDSMTEWRELCAKYKAENIEKICNGKLFSSVLECGAGEGSILKFLEKNNFCDVLYATEISESGISQLKKRALSKLVEIKKFDGYEIPYADKKFDLVFCSHVLEHVEHPRILLRELKRVSNYQAFEIPLDYSPCIDERAEHLFSYGHINVFTPATFKFLLKSEGFEILSERYTHMSPDVVEFNWYRNMGIKKSFLNDTKLKLIPIKRFLRNLRYLHLNKEIGYSAYTCLVKGNGQLSVF